jgi:hypothetical protein
MASKPSYIKDPDAVLDYALDWNPWLSDGETISTSTFVATGGITIGDGTNGGIAPSCSLGIATVWLLGGSAGAVYEITNSITTNQGRADDRTFTVRVQER